MGKPKGFMTKGVALKGVALKVLALKVVAVIVASMMLMATAACSNTGTPSPTGATTPTDATTPADAAAPADATTPADPANPADAADIAAEQIKKYDKELTLDVFAADSNFQGIIGGYGGKIWQDKFNVKINIIAPNIAGDAIFQTRSAAGHLGDIIVYWTDRVADLATSGLVMELSGLLASNGPNLSQYMDNIELLSDIIGSGGIHALPIGMTTYSPLEPLPNPASGMMSNQDGAASYIRWDIYKQIGMPPINNLDDYLDVLEAMQKAHPTGDNGQPAYAMTLFKDWDWAGPHNVKGGIPQMYGYHTSPGTITMFRYADPTTLKYQTFDDDNGIYRKALEFYFKANQRGILDPDAATHTWNDVVTKTQDGRILSGLWPWTTITQYNNAERGNADEPIGFQFVPIADAMYFNNGYNPVSSGIIAIGAQAQDPERIMDILDWMATPEGMMVTYHGPQGMQWDIDANGAPYRTALGDQVANDPTTVAPAEFGGGVVTENSAGFALMFNRMEINPETGVAYDMRMWPETRARDDSQLNKDWRAVMNAEHMIDYVKKNNMLVVSPGNMYIAPPWTPEMESTRSIYAGILTTASWQMIYARDEAEFNALWDNMKAELHAAGWEQSVQEDIAFVKELNEACLVIIEGANH